MTFISKPKKQALTSGEEFKTIRPSFRERQFGSEFNQWELKLIKNFSYAKKSKQALISGCVVYDHSLGRGRFLLIPAAHLPQDYVICECPPGLSVPSNLSNVTINGTKKVFYDYWEIMVDKISYDKPQISIKPEIDFKEFQDQLFLKWGGILSPLRELLAFEFVSSPPLLDLGQTGGLSVTLYDGTQKKESNALLKYFKEIIPLDIAQGKSGTLAIPELAADQPLSPFSWTFRSFDADKPLNQHLTNFLDKRKSKRFSEISLGLGSKHSQPKTIYDPPFTRVDQPTLLPDNVEMLRMSYFDPPLEVTKYLITMKMLFPTIGNVQADIDPILDSASKKIVDTAESYDMPQAVRKHGLFDPNYYGKPQSVLRLALASARSEEKLGVNKDYVLKTFDDFYLKNLETVLDSWEDVMSSKGIELVSLNEFDRQVLKFITNNETNDFGVGLASLQDRFPDEIKLRLSLDRLKTEKVGKIYEIKQNVFRSFPFA